MTETVTPRDTQVLAVDGREWETPLTRVPARTLGRARIVHVDYDKDEYYAMNQVGGYFAYRVESAPLPVTVLQLYELDGEWHDWMVDDPCHWLGMGERVEDLNPGSVLVAGLGLGLMLHHMVERDDLTEITVVEREQDVVDLVRPTLPPDPRVTIVRDDYYSYLARYHGSPGGRRPDSVLWDLAVGDQQITGGQIGRGLYETSRALPGVDTFVFGLVRRGPA